MVTHFVRGRNLRNALRQYGEETILSHVLYATIMIQPSRITNRPMDYFTDQFIYHVNQYVIDYKMIDWMYQYKEQSQYNSCKVIRIFLINGEKYDICQWMQDENMQDIIRLCRQNNSKIMTEYSRNNKIEHIKRVQAYKNGTLTVIPMSLEKLTQPVLSKPLKKAVGGYAIVNLQCM